MINPGKWIYSSVEERLNTYQLPFQFQKEVLFFIGRWEFFKYCSDSFADTFPAQIRM